MLKLQYFGHLIGKHPDAAKDWRQKRWLDGIMIQCTWTWANSGRWQGTGKPGMLPKYGIEVIFGVVRLVYFPWCLRPHSKELERRERRTTYSYNTQNSSKQAPSSIPNYSSIVHSLSANPSSIVQWLKYRPSPTPKVYSKFLFVESVVPSPFLFGPPRSLLANVAQRQLFSSDGENMGPSPPAFPKTIHNWLSEIVHTKHSFSTL